MLESNPPGKGPLAGVRVLDLTRVLAGPYCTMILADLGANVTKVEDCQGGDQTRHMPPFINGMSHYFLAINRNKRSIAIDAKHSKGRDMIHRLAMESDILIENFRPGVMDSLGCSLEALREVNPRLITCSISGFGQQGSLSKMPAYDIITQAMSGMMSVNGLAGGSPLKLGIPLADLGGGLWATIGILAALQNRSVTGEGCNVDISMLEALMAQLGYLSQLYFVTGESPVAVGNGHHIATPYGCYQTKDGPIVIAALNQKQFQNFCHVTGHEELIHDVRFRTAQERNMNRLELERLVEQIIATKSQNEWVRLFEAGDVPCAQVNTIEQALEQPIVREREFVRTIKREGSASMRVMGSPIKFSNSWDTVEYNAPPEHGEQTLEILGELGFSLDEIAACERDGVIKPWTEET